MSRSTKGGALLNQYLLAQSVNFGMGTVITNRAFGKYAEKSIKIVEEEGKRLEALLSRFVPGSEISRINREAGIKCQRLSPDTYEILSRAIEISSSCSNYFDVTIGPLTALWNKAKETSKPPDTSVLRELLSLVNYRDLVLDPVKKTAMLRKPGQCIDLGAIGKGYAGDKFIEIFRKYGVSSAFSNIGGNVVAIGKKPDGSNWSVGIQHPRQEDKLIGFVLVADKAVVTSGDYQRYFVDNKGKRQHHILNPSTGCPSEAGLLSATVIADSSTIADALSTVLFVAGIKKGAEVLSRFPGADAIFIDSNLQTYITPGLKKDFYANEDTGINILNYGKESINEEERKD